MHRFGRIAWIALAVLTGLPCVVAAVPTGPSEASGPAAVRLLAPADGAVLSGGATATLAWEPGPGMSLDGADEWEAFLSLDGGATWPVRITPHLDLSLRRVTFPVPSVPSDDVRLLLRVGDEQSEAPFEVPGTFTITAITANPSALLPAAVTRYATGESALPGGRGVVAWVEGNRSGGDRQVAVALPFAAGWSGVHLEPIERLPLVAEHDPTSHDFAAPSRRVSAEPVPAPRYQHPRSRPAPPGARDILLATERLDE